MDSEKRNLDKLVERLYKNIQVKDYIYKKYYLRLIKHGELDASQDCITNIIMKENNSILLNDGALIKTLYALDINTKKQLALKIFDKYNPDVKIQFLDNKYVLSNFESVIIDSLAKFIEELEKFNENKTYFYRGHSNCTYELLPSIYRTSTLYENESNMVKDLITKYPETFQTCKSHLDYLTIMQHYGLPTRMLDFTLNPLIALYFACASNNDKLGEVLIFEENKENFKGYDSDSIELLTNLAFLNNLDKHNLYEYATNDYKTDDFLFSIKKMYHSIKSERSWFDDSPGILNAKDLLEPKFVYPKQNNKRIQNQNGIFLIYGLTEKDNNKDEEILNSVFHVYAKRAKLGDKFKKLLITNKSRILKELKALNITNSFVRPEIEQYTSELTQRYSSENHPERILCIGEVECFKCKSYMTIAWIEEKTTTGINYIFSGNFDDAIKNLAFKYGCSIDKYSFCNNCHNPFSDYKLHELLNDNAVHIIDRIKTN